MKPIPKTKRWNRKGKCPGCGAGCGTNHHPACRYNIDNKTSYSLPIMTGDFMNMVTQGYLIRLYREKHKRTFNKIEKEIKFLLTEQEPNIDIDKVVIHVEPHITCYIKNDEEI